MPKKIDITGHTYGKLKVVCQHGKTKHCKITWLCVCTCGQKKIASSNDLRMGKVKTCGSSLCVNINIESAHEAKATHKQSKTRLYRIWAGMKRRCEYRHERYSLRGISYCDEWKDFEPFFKWAQLSGYTDQLTLDRIDNDGNYNPDNCRWATRKEQSRNTSKNRLIHFNGEISCLHEWAERFNINSRTLSDRLNRGWSIEKALLTKSRTGYEGSSK